MTALIFCSWLKGMGSYHHKATMKFVGVFFSHLNSDQFEELQKEEAALVIPDSLMSIMWARGMAIVQFIINKQRLVLYLSFTNSLLDIS